MRSIGAKLVAHRRLCRVAAHVCRDVSGKALAAGVWLQRNRRDDRLQHRPADRFRQMLVEARLQGFDLIVVLAISGEGDEVGVARCLVRASASAT